MQKVACNPCNKQLLDWCKCGHCKNEARIRLSKMADTFTEENMKTLIKEMFQEEFKKQAENMTNLISGNFKLTMQEIHENEVNDLRKSLAFTQKNLEEKVDNVEKRMEKLESDIQEIY